MNKEEIDELYEHEFSNWCDKDEVSELINNMPTVDIEPVRHGSWLRVGQSFIDPNKFLCFECSICGCTLDNHIKVEQNYCPNCGARMDGEEQNNG